MTITVPAAMSQAQSVLAQLTTVHVAQGAGSDAAEASAQPPPGIDVGLINACGEFGRSFICERTYQWFGNETLASAMEFLLHRPLRILMVLVLAWLGSRVVNHAIIRLVKRIAAAPSGVRLRALKERGIGVEVIEKLEREDTSRDAARAETLGYVLRSIALALIWVFAGLMVLGEIGLNLGPLIAGAGIAGIALGFGAQSVVKDFLSGLFMLIEDHYGVGDMVDFGGTMGTVEELTLRSTTFRDRNGTVWHVPNGEITRIGNFSQTELRARINVEVAYDTDLRLAMQVIDRVGEEMWATDWCRELLSRPPKVSGVQNLGASSIEIRTVVTTLAGLPWPSKRSMEREFRLRLMDAFTGAQIETPFPQRTVWIRTEGENPPNELKPPMVITPELLENTPEFQRQASAETAAAESADAES